MVLFVIDSVGVIGMWWICEDNKSQTHSLGTHCDLSNMQLAASQQVEPVLAVPHGWGQFADGQVRRMLGVYIY